MIKLLSVILWFFQGAAFLAAILYWNKYKTTTQRYFVYFLAYVVVHETMGYFVGSNNLYIYNVYIILSFAFYLFWFYLILKHKRMIIALSIVFFISVCIAVLFENFWNDLWKIPSITGTIIVLINSTLFYRSLLNKAEVVDYQKSQEFWIVTGLLIFYIAFLPILMFWRFIDNTSLPFRIIITVLNIILSGCFIMSFLCLRKK